MYLQVEESEARKDINRQRTSSSSTEITEEQVYSAISRVLCINWKEKNSQSIHIPETAESIRENPQVPFEDLISQSIIEVLTQIAIGTNPLKNIVTEDNSLNSSPTQSPSNDLPSVQVSESPQNIALLYLTESYSRVALEERNNPKRSSIPPLSDVLADLRAQLVHYAALVLQGMIVEPDVKTSRETSTLLAPLINQTLPRGFVSELVARTHANAHVFSKIFSPVLQGLFLIMQQASIVGNEHRQPVQVRK